MNGTRSLSAAMARGFVRDRATVFFTILFPLMFLLLLGTMFRSAGTEPSTVLQVGGVPVLDSLPGPARAELARIVDLQRTDDQAAALDQVRKGDVEAAVTQSGDQIVVHYSAADQVQSGSVRGVLAAIVQEANIRSAGVTEPRYALSLRPVEDTSLQPIQFLTPGLLGWAVASGATFGAALTLVTWRAEEDPAAAALGARAGHGRRQRARRGQRRRGAAADRTVHRCRYAAVLRPAALGLLVDDYSACGRRHPGVPGDRSPRRSGVENPGSGDRGSQPDRASDGVPVRRVLPARSRAGVAPRRVERLPAQASRGERAGGNGARRRSGATLGTFGILLGFTVVVSAVAVRLFRWDDV